MCVNHGRDRHTVCRANGVPLNAVVVVVPVVLFARVSRGGLGNICVNEVSHELQKGEDFILVDFRLSKEDQ